METNNYEKRSKEIADTIRRYLVAINTGGIGVTFAVAGAFANHQIDPAWAVWPVGMFAIGLIVTGGSLFLAKHKALKRRNALRNKQSEPDFTKWRWRNFTWDLVALGFFLLGVGVGLYQIHKITFTEKDTKKPVAMYRFNKNYMITANQYLQPTRYPRGRSTR